MSLAKRLFCEEVYSEDDQFTEEHSYVILRVQQTRIPIVKRMEILENHRLKCLKGWINCDDDFNRLWFNRLLTCARYMDGLRMLLEINISVSLL